MRLFLYYATRSFKNQIKKLLKTWVLIFIVACMLIGGLIGFGAASISDVAQKHANDTKVAEEQESKEEEEDEDSGPSFWEKQDVDKGDMVELVAGIVILVFLLFEIVGADKNGSKIFLPADVNLLFASPMKPQSVLMFRVATQLGVSLIASIYLLFQMPNLVYNLGLDVGASLAIIAAWGFTIMFGTLFQVLFFILCSTYSGLKSVFRRAVYAVSLVIGISYVIFWKRSDVGSVKAAALFFNGKATRIIPVWGWVKGLCMYAVEGNVLGACLSLLAILIGIGVLLYVIWHIKADFYEEAMAKSEEMAELMEQIQSEKSTGIGIARKPKKDRSDKLKRDGMKHGFGANVFFYKALYNRFRFAHLGIFTKTVETYLFFMIAVSVFCRFVIHTNSILIAALTLSGLAFYRSLGNPLEQDTKMDYFVLIPENTWAKMFWSVLGGTVNCLLDVLPAMLVAVIFIWANPLVALAWIPFILSVDFYATNVGAFINLSVPVSAGKSIKQMVLVLFVYFGLLPDVAVMAFGIASGHEAAAAVLCAILNVGLGFLFFGLAPIFLDPREGGHVMQEEEMRGDVKEAGRQFSRLGFGAFVILVVAELLQVLLSEVVKHMDRVWLDRTWFVWLLRFAPLYLIAIPIGLLIIKKVPVTPIEKRDPKLRNIPVVVMIAIFMMYSGNIIGNIVTGLLQLILRLPAQNPVYSLVMEESLFWKMLIIVFLGPLIEEFVFRKQLIDRMNIYGERIAVVTSAVMFGLFHGNLSQLFYAFGLGLVFGFIYLKTGKLRYSAALHMCINFLGGVFGPWLAQNIGIDKLMTADLTEKEAIAMLLSPQFLMLMAYGFIMIGLAIAGLVLFCIKVRKLHFNVAERQLPRGTCFKTVYLNVGMILLVLGCIAEIVVATVM